MNSTVIIQLSASDGVRVALTSAGSIKIICEADAVARCLLLVRDHMSDIPVSLEQPVNQVLRLPKMKRWFAPGLRISRNMTRESPQKFSTSAVPIRTPSPTSYAAP